MGVVVSGIRRERESENVRVSRTEKEWKKEKRRVRMGKERGGEKERSKKERKKWEK